MTNEKKPGSTATPAAEVDVDEALVRTLLEEQHADLAHLPINLLETGWDNYTFRLGKDYAVRLPRREVAATLIINEQTWLPVLAPQLPLPVPAPKRIGVPGQGYPWNWSVLPWLAGTAADLSEPDEFQAEPLVAFLRALHGPAPKDAPFNPVRGIPLSERIESVEERLLRLEKNTDAVTLTIRHVWQEALAAPVHTDAMWLHGDMHARNILVKDGTISGVIDWGDMTSGDVATDLASIWMLLGDKDARARAIAAYGADEATWARAKGWAVLFGAVLLDTGLVDTPRHAVMGRTTLARIHEDCS